MEKVANKYALTVSPDEMKAAMRTLSLYVAERHSLVEFKKITDVPEAVRLMDAMFQFKEELAKMVKSPAEKVYDMIRFSMLPNIMDGEGITSMGVEDVGRVNLQDDVSVKVLDKDGLKTWLVERELEDMITEVVNAQTLAAFVRRRMKAVGEKPGDEKVQADNELPTNVIIEIKPVVRAVITRS